MKVHLIKIRLNKQGYDTNGDYFGIGNPLYSCYSDEYGDIWPGYFRANDRNHAKRLVRYKIPKATFYR